MGKCIRGSDATGKLAVALLVCLVAIGGRVTGALAEQIHTVGAITLQGTLPTAGNKAIGSTSGATAYTRAVSLLLDMAPAKQVNVVTMQINPAIGRTPGSACEVLRFLARAKSATMATEVMTDKLYALADWVISIQAPQDGSPWSGGVPSTPDLAGVSGRYYYGFDAALCGGAMFAAFDATQEPRFRASAIRFARNLVKMHRGLSHATATQEGFCEFVIRDPNPAWNCSNYVKMLIALPVLRRAAVETQKSDFEAVAAKARAYLVEGLQGAWEYASPASGSDCRRRRCQSTWHRIPGPNSEPDWFTYGDTIAYALRGLFEYEGPSDTVSNLYKQFAAYKGTGSRTSGYDGRLACAGYLSPNSGEPDSFSAYYDLVTLGVLNGVRAKIDPEAYRRARLVLRERAMGYAMETWSMGFDLTPTPSEFMDLTTIANLAEAYILGSPDSPPATEADVRQLGHARVVRLLRP